MINIIAIAMAAVLAVESQNGADKRAGDGGRAVGAFQTWPIAVNEASQRQRTRRIRSRLETISHEKVSNITFYAPSITSSTF
jgi:hypothetical protein